MALAYTVWGSLGLPKRHKQGRKRGSSERERERGRDGENFRGGGSWKVRPVKGEEGGREMDRGRERERKGEEGSARRGKDKETEWGGLERERR